MNAEISQIKAGHILGATVTASSVSIPVTATPTLNLPPISAPVVQTVTKAS